MIYICIPVLNEAPTVGVLLWRIRQVMAEFRRDYHLIVLDDASTDATAEVLAPYEKVLPLTVLRNERTGGYAAAVERLLREAVDRSTHPKRDIAVVVQADFTEPPEEIPSLVKKLEGGADIVGSAVAGVEGELTRGQRWSRRGLPWLLGRAALPRESGDPLSGFRAYRVQVIRRALADREGAPLLTRQGWAANAELLMAVAPHARRADQAEVRLRLTRRERETRFDPWPALRETWELARRAPRRVLGPPPEAATAVAAPAPEPAATATRPAARPPRPSRPVAAAPTASAVTEAAEEDAVPAERPRRQRPPRTRRPRSAAPDADTAPAATADAVTVDGRTADDATEGAPAKRARRQRPRRPRKAAAPEGAELVTTEEAEAPREGRRRPPRRNRKRGRRDGNTEDQPE